MAQNASQDRLGVTRRMFAVAGICGFKWRDLKLAGGLQSSVLDAIAAERMPRRLVVYGVTRSPFFEMRAYEIVLPQFLPIWKKHGIQPVSEENGKFLIPFDSLVSREKAWSKLSADPEWMALQKIAVVKEITVYRTS